MKAFLTLIILTIMYQAIAEQQGVSPIGKVIELLSGYQSKIKTEGQAIMKTYNKFVDWCGDRSSQLSVGIKTKTSRHESKVAIVEAEGALISSLTTKLEEYSESIATAEESLKKAITLRSKEEADFAAEQQELLDVIRTLDQATNILERKDQANEANLLQVQNAQSLAQVMSSMVAASMFNSADSDRLQSLVQMRSSSSTNEDATEDDEDDGEMSNMDDSQRDGNATPHASSIIKELEDLSDKANAQLDDARQKETAALNNFKLLKAQLERQIAQNQKHMDRTKSELAESAEEKSTAEAKVVTLLEGMKQDKVELDDLQHECMTKAQDFQSGMKSRDEELRALNSAQKILQEVLDQRTEQDQAPESSDEVFVQVMATSKLHASSSSAGFDTVRILRKAARDTGSARLKRLAFQMVSVLQRTSRSSIKSPFDKVKGMITRMIKQLEKEASSEASQKQFCDEELEQTRQKKEDSSKSLQKLTTKRDKVMAGLADVKQEVAEISQELAELAVSKGELDTLRQEQKSEFAEQKTELEQASSGVKQALKVLKNYYAKEGEEDQPRDGAGGVITGILSLLEQVESDFAKSIAEITASENSAQTEYEAAVHETKQQVNRKTVQQKMKVKEVAYLQKTISQVTSDQSSAQDVLDATLQYLRQVEGKCIAKPEPYEDRAERRRREIAGLKSALDTLGDDTSLIELSSKRSLRGGGNSLNA